MTLNLRMSKVYKTNTFLLGNSGIIPTFLKDAGVENVQTQGKTALQNYRRKIRAYFEELFHYQWLPPIRSQFRLLQIEVDDLQLIRCSVHLYIDLHFRNPAERLTVIGYNTVQPYGFMHKCFFREEYKPSTKPPAVSYPSALPQLPEAPNRGPACGSQQHFILRETYRNAQVRTAPRKSRHGQETSKLLPAAGKGMPRYAWTVVAIC